MIDFRACPRCNGDVLEYFPADSERALCINCGWRAGRPRGRIRAGQGSQGDESHRRRLQARRVWWPERLGQFLKLHAGPRSLSRPAG